MPLPLLFTSAFLLAPSVAGAAAETRPAERGHRYFRSWVSYQMPVKPTDPVAYEQSEDAVSLYRGEFDADGRLVRFTKLFREAQALGPATGEPAGVGDYREALPDGRGLRPGNRIDFRDTENQPAYFKVESVEGVPTLRLITVSVEFDHHYSYWPNGALREHTLAKADGSRRTVRYDQQGRKLPDQPEP